MEIAESLFALEPSRLVQFIFQTLQAVLVNMTDLLITTKVQGIFVCHGAIRADAYRQHQAMLLVNTSTSRIVEDHVGNGPQGKIQIEATNSDAIMSIISAGTADANRCGTISLGRHRNSTVGATPTIVQNGDSLGAIVFAAGDGTDMRTSGAKIHAIVNGTPGSNDMPGLYIFYNSRWIFKSI